MQRIVTIPDVTLNENDIPYNLSQDGEDGHIALAGAINTRDLGYLVAEDGRRIKPHKLIRSGALVDIAERDALVLKDEYDVRTVIDFRTDEEQLKNPDPQDEMFYATFIEAPILEKSTFGITRESGRKNVMDALKAIKSDPVKLMSELYPKMLLSEQGRLGYRKFFEVLLDAQEGSVLWHCSAGKDRAGLATVLLLMALGVSWIDIKADYLATNKYMASKTEQLLTLLADHGIADELEENVHLLNSADLRFLYAGIDAAVAEYGSIDGYFNDALGVTADKIDVLRTKYLI